MKHALVVSFDLDGTITDGSFADSVWLEGIPRYYAGKENISFEESFELAIQAKQDATQEALKEQELVAAKEAKARQVVAEAQGEASRLVTVAAGQADANDLIARSLTPELIQFQAMQKLADNIQIALLPAGQGIIIDPTTILGGQAAAK